jgi:sugar O-acyltransferase (sialic acid O-acetyltransferase NeuD family)
VSRLYVVGTRSFAAEVVDFAVETGLEIAGLLEPFDRARVGTTIHDLSVTWLEETGAARALVATGERSRRLVVGRLRAAGWTIDGLVHPRAHIARSSTVGDGAIVAPGVVVGARARIGEHVLLGRGVLVGHHTEIDSFATVNPGANIAGNVKVGKDAFVGMGAVVRDHVAVGASAVVAAGAVVLGDVDDGAEVRGFPARVHEPTDLPAGPHRQP